MLNLIKYLSVSMVLLAYRPIVLAQEMTMPVAIPHTTIDFMQSAPTRPSTWDEGTPGYYYINSASGTDSNNSYGSESTPRKTLPKPIPAGSYVEIAGEYSYTSGGVIKIYAQGTSDDWKAGVSGPVWITSAQTSPAYLINSKAIAWGKNLFLTDINVKDGSRVQIGSSSDGYPAENIVIRNSEIVGTESMGNSSLLSVAGTEDDNAKNIILYNNVIRDAGNIDVATDVDAGLVIINGYSSYVWVLDNHGYNASGSALQINAKPPKEACHHIFAGNNHFHHARQSGLWIKYATDVVFSSNYVHHIKSTTWSPSKGIGGQYEPNGLWIINNLIHDVEYGVRLASTTNIDDSESDSDLEVYVLGNIIFNTQPQQKADNPGDENLASIGTDSAWESAAIHLHGGQERYIVNNLLFNNSNGINHSRSADITVVKNNIIIDTDNGHQAGVSGYHVLSDQSMDLDNMAICNNYFDDGVAGDDDKETYINMSGNITERIATFNTAVAPLNTTTTNGRLNCLNVAKDIIDDPVIDSPEYGEKSEIESAILAVIDSSNITGITDSGADPYVTLSPIFDVLVKDIDSETGQTTSIKYDYLGSPRIVGEIDIGPLERQSSESSTEEVSAPSQFSVYLSED